MNDHAPADGAEAVSVVVCTYTEDRFQLLRETVSSLEAQTRPPDEIVVVVDHNPSLAQRVAEHFPQLNVVESAAASSGLSGARNTALQCTTGAIVAFIDDDAVADPEWLMTLLREFSDSRVLVAGSRVLPRWVRPAPRWFPEEFGWVLGCSYRGQTRSSSPHSVRNVIGNGMALRRSATTVGSFRTELGRFGTVPLGCEETEWCIRVRQAIPDARILQVPAAVLHHHVPADRTRLARYLRHCYGEGLSKAVVAESVGSGAATAAERRYAAWTLPTGVLRRLFHGARGDFWQFVQAAAMCAGFAAAVLGYAKGRSQRLMFRRRSVAPAPPARGGEPLWTAQYDLADDLGVIPVTKDKPGSFRRARVLVRRGPRLLGFADVRVVDGRVTGAELELECHRLSAALVPPLTLEPSECGIGGRGPETPQSAGTTPAFTVAVCTRDRPEALARCLASLQLLLYSNFEVLVVDNAPSDTRTRSLVAALAAEDSRVHYVQEPRAGVSNARNRALQESSSDYIAMADDDVIVDRWWLHALSEGFQAGPRVACVTGMTASSRLVSSAERYFDARVGWSSRLQPALYRLDSPPEDQPLFPYQAWLFGAGAGNCAFERLQLFELGGFDPTLGPGTPTQSAEDLDLFVRVIRSGRSIAYQPTALAWHFHRADEAELRRQMRGYGRGLSALGTKWLTDRSTRRELLERAPSALGPLARSWLRSAMTVATEASGELDPTGVVVAELLGALAGPATYLHARLLSRRHLTYGPSSRE